MLKVSRSHRVTSEINFPMHQMIFAQGRLFNNYNVALIAIRWYRIVLCKISLLHMMNEDETSQRVVKEWDMVETSSIGLLERFRQYIHLAHQCPAGPAKYTLDIKPIGANLFHPASLTHNTSS